MSESKIGKGDLVMIVFESRKRGLKKLLVRLGDERIHTHRGFIEPDDVVGMPWGSVVRTSKGYEVLIVRPSTADLMEKIARRTQIVYPKDAGLMILKAGVKPGDTVVEGGTGSGSLAYALSLAVGESGRVVSYEIRPEFLELARKNLEMLGAKNVELKLGDLRKDVEERGVDEFFIDMGAPWEALPMAWEALKSGGAVCVFVPSCEQVKKTVVEARRSGFGAIEVMECLVRNYLVDEKRTRPCSRMIGHTGFIIVGRKVSRGEHER